MSILNLKIKRNEDYFLKSKKLFQIYHLNLYNNMNWPPVKAWTSLYMIEGQVHFVAINYGGELVDRWVILMSVLDSALIVKVLWSQLLDSSKWVCGWDENNYSKPSKTMSKKDIIETTYCSKLSDDSGLTIPITKNTIRPWFTNS